MGFGINNLKQLKGQALNKLGNGALDSIPGLGGKLKANFNSNGLQSISGNFNNLLKKKQRDPRRNSPLRDLYIDNHKVSESIVFPADLDDEHYIMFHVIDRKRPSRETVVKNRVMQTIVLPIPSALTNNMGVSYNNENLGIIGSVAAGRQSLAEATKGGGDVVNKIMSNMGGLLPGNELTSEASGEVDAAAIVLAATAAASIGGGAFAALGGIGGASQALKGAGLAEGAAMNPHTAVLFDNVNFREFAFEYKFMARNKEESATITKLINTFQIAMSPSISWAGGNMFEYPEEFNIEFADGLKKDLFQIGRCVLKSVNVNYNGENMPVFFEDGGAPVSVVLSLAFQETEILTKEKFGWTDLDEAKYADDIGVSEY